jgi:TRAP-type C4-dicarboxylate transport system permease small subunit
MKLSNVKNKIIPALDKSLVAIDTFALTSIVVIGVVGVILRYIFNKPLFWGMELSTSLAVWMTFIIAGYNYKHNTHFSVDIIHGALNNKLKTINDIIVFIITFFCVSICLYSAIVAFTKNYKMSMAAMEISVSFSLYLPVIIGYITYILYMILCFITRIKKLNREDV